MNVIRIGDRYRGETDKTGIMELEVTDIVAEAEGLHVETVVSYQFKDDSQKHKRSVGKFVLLLADYEAKKVKERV